MGSNEGLSQPDRLWQAQEAGSIPAERRPAGVPQGFAGAGRFLQAARGSLIGRAKVGRGSRGVCGSRKVLAGFGVGSRSAGAQVAVGQLLFLSFYGRAHSPALPCRIPIAWGNTVKITARFSFTARGLPGRLMIRVRPRLPATARESMA